VTTAEQITDACAQHGEGPIWDASAGCVRWVDMLNGDVLSMLPPDGAVTRLHVGSIAAAIRPRVNGGLVVAVERGFALLDPGATEVLALPEIWSDPTVRMNDGACDPQGRFYCGSMAYDAAADRGSLYRLDPDRSVATVLTGVTISNGLAWRAGGETALYVDSPTGRIDELEFDADDGTFTRRSPAIAIEVDGAVPDGIALDADDGVWVALWGGGAVHRYDGHGALDEVIELPVRHVTACALDPDGRLFITTSTAGEEGDSVAGALFSADVGVAGAPIGAFAG
jgi:sugar lactone lactonase YvrE